MNQKQWFVCPIVRKWDEMETIYMNRRIPMSIEGAGVGFLEIYDSLESYNAQYPDIKPWLMVTEHQELQP